MSGNKPEAIVVGSGFGGLASAFELLAKGYQVKVLEAGDQPGGRARVFEKQGYTFDAGPTVITAPYLFDELFALVGEKTEDWVEFVPVDPFYRIIYDDGSQFDYVGEQDRLIENIRKISPQDVDGYLRLEKHAKEIFDVGYTQLADQPFPDVSSMLRVVPDMVRLQNYRSVYSLVSKYIKNEKLRQAFSFEPLLVGGNPFKITSIYLLIHWLERKWGVHFAKGGTSALVKGLVGALEKHGVEFVYNSPVTSLDVEKGKVSGVRCEHGAHYNCDVLVSNTDPIKVYNEWIDEKWLKKHKSFRVNRKSQSMSLFVSYFGVKKKFDNLVHHTILMGPRYKGLLNDIFSKKTLADDFSLYLHAPTVTDPALGPQGSETFYVLSPVPNNQSGINWENEKEAYQEKIFNSLEKRLLPGLKENLEVSFSITPDYFQNDLRSTQGSAFGIEPSFTQSAYFRFHNQSEDVKGLYFVGAQYSPWGGSSRSHQFGQGFKTDCSLWTGASTMSQWEGVMKKHAKSFYLASLFFPRSLLPRVKALYALCRWLDDAVDEAPNEEAAQKALETIANDLHSPESQMPVNQLYKSNQLEVGYIDDLIQGAKDDLQTVRVQSKQELVQYSYKVAGTVGLAMFDLMKVEPLQARANAVDLGIAMQITNICRDVKEDLLRNRIYLPLDFLSRYQISEEEFRSGLYRPEQLSGVIRETLQLADEYYASAEVAFQNIPWRTRGAIIIATRLYRGIGLKLLKNGADPMRGRTFLTGLEKVQVVAGAVGSWLVSAFRKPQLQHDPKLHQGLEYWRQLRGFEF